MLTIPTASLVPRRKLRAGIFSAFLYRFHGLALSVEACHACDLAPWAAGGLAFTPLPNQGHSVPGEWTIGLYATSL